MTPLNCHNCGGPLPGGGQYCPHCAAAVVSQSSRPGLSALRIVSAVFLICIAMGLGALGACVALIAVVAGPQSSGGDGGFWGGLAVVTVLFLGCVAGAIKLLKPKRKGEP